MSSDQRVKEEIIDALNSGEELKRKIERLIDLSRQMTKMDADTLRAIDSRLKGTYGSEYAHSQGEYGSLIELYQILNEKDPHSYEVLLSLADLLLLDGQHSFSFDLFNQAFRHDPLLLFNAPGELGEHIDRYGSQSQKIHYKISLSRAFVLDGNLEDAREEYGEVTQLHGEEGEFVQSYFQTEDLKNEFLSLLNEQ
ncbi:MAG: hypothetical protein ACRC0L_07125 [Angustibacter sp.]